MMSLASLAAGLFLPWAAGSLWIAAIWRALDRHACARVGNASGLVDVPGRLAVTVGYGHVLGLMLLSAIMRIASAAEWRFSWLSVGVPLLVAVLLALSMLALLASRRATGATATSLPAPTIPGRHASRSFERALVCVLLILLVHRFAAMAVEVWLRPIYPWDAFIQWSTKARVWFERGQLAPFVTTENWLVASGLAYTDASPGYAGTVPMLQTWTAVALGRWDPSLVNLPWLLCAIALCAGLFGQLRMAGMPRSWALAGTYCVASLPFLNAHTALAGYADLHMATVFGLAASAFTNWAIAAQGLRSSVTGRDDPARTINGILATVLALSLPLWKNPGPIWLASFVPAALVAVSAKRGMQVVVASLLVAAIVVATLATTSPVILNYQLHLDFTWVGGALARNLFSMGNWHLLWWIVAVVLFAARRQLLSRAYLPSTVLLATCTAVLLVVFFFSNAAVWVTDYSTVNRAVLHVTPFVGFYSTILMYEYWRRVVEKEPWLSRPPKSDGAADTGVGRGAQ